MSRKQQIQNTSPADEVNQGVELAPTSNEVVVDVGDGHPYTLTANQRRIIRVAVHEHRMGLNCGHDGPDCVAIIEMLQDVEAIDVD